MVREYRLAEQTIDESDLEDLIAWLKTNPWLTQGPQVRAFEVAWARWMGVKYAVFVNSGSSANLLAYYALLVSGRLRNRKVVVPAVSWSTTVAPAIQLGFEPLMCEAEAQSFGLDANHLENLLRAHDPAVVVVVHVLGVPCDMKALTDLRSQYGFALVEDACSATGSRFQGRRVGTFGDMSTFSFFYGHHLSTIEGGMVCTDDEALYDILLQVRSHGWPKDLSSTKEAAQARVYEVGDFNRRFTFYYPGFNVRSTDLNARIGLTQLRKIERVVERRVENHATYQSKLRGTAFHYQQSDCATICSISFAALACSAEHRDSIARALDAHRIETRPVGGGNMSRQPFWAERYGATVFPVADRIHSTGFQLPNHPQLDAEDITRICEIVLSVKE